MKVGERSVMSDEEKGYTPEDYSFGIFLQCTSEQEVASAMEKLVLPVVGLALDGINVILMRMPTSED